MSQGDLPQTTVDAPRWPPVGERYVSRRELATLMGVSLATVDRMVAEGDAVGDVGAAYTAFQGLVSNLVGIGA